MHAEATGNSPAPPELFADASASEQREDGRWLIVDGGGNRLDVDLDALIVHAEDGPDGVLPGPYSFGCPPEVYPGTLPS